MIPPSHALSGIGILRILSIIIPSIRFNTYTIILSMIFQILPDLDVFWSKNLNDHHKSNFHSVLFWMIVFLIGFITNSIFHLVPEWILYLFIIQIMFHLFFDLLTTRSAGLVLFYPLSKKGYHIFPLEKEQGNINPFSLRSEIEFSKIYTHNKAQLLIELVVTGFGVIALFV